MKRGRSLSCCWLLVNYLSKERWMKSICTTGTVYLVVLGGGKLHQLGLDAAATQLASWRTGWIENVSRARGQPRSWYPSTNVQMTAGVALNSILRWRKDVVPSRRSQKRRSLTVSTLSRRGSSLRGIRSSEYQAAAAAAQNHNRQKNYCHSATSSPYISVAVLGTGKWKWTLHSASRVLAFVRFRATMSPGRTPWVLAAGVTTVGSLLRITLHITVHPISLTLIFIWL